MFHYLDEKPFKLPQLSYKKGQLHPFNWISSVCVNFCVCKRHDQDRLYNIE